MKKKIPDMMKEYELILKDHLSAKGLLYSANSILTIAQAKAVDECER